MDKKRSVLVLGVGNLLLKDEGVGVHVAHRLMDMELPSDVDVLDGATGGLDLLDYIDGRDKVVIVDTVKGDHPPGTIYRMGVEDIEAALKCGHSLHDVSIADVLNVADTLGVARPDIVIIGIEPKDMQSADLELSPEIEAKVPRLIELVLKEIGQ